jgi:hypothetical protein
MGQTGFCFQPEFSEGCALDFEYRVVPETKSASGLAGDLPL